MLRDCSLRGAPYGIGGESVSRQALKHFVRLSLEHLRRVLDRSVGNGPYKIIRVDRLPAETTVTVEFEYGKRKTLCRLQIEVHVSICNRGTRFDYADR